MTAWSTFNPGNLTSIIIHKHILYWKCIHYSVTAAEAVLISCVCFAAGPFNMTSNVVHPSLFYACAQGRTDAKCIAG